MKTLPQTLRFRHYNRACREIRTIVFLRQELSRILALNDDIISGRHAESLRALYVDTLDRDAPRYGVSGDCSPAYGSGRVNRSSKAL